MSEHKYRVGQEVEFFPERGVEHAAKGRFIVVRLFLGEQYALLSDQTRGGRAREKSARTRIDTKTMPRPLRWIDGSNPVSSSGESDANSQQGSGANTAGCRGRRGLVPRADYDGRLAG
jgi:hypothetical protein